MSTIEQSQLQIAGSVPENGIPPAETSRASVWRALARGQVQPLLAMASTVGVSFAITLLQTAQAILLARILQPEGRGEYATAVFYTYTFTFVGMLGTQFSIARRAAKMSGGLLGLERSSFRLGLSTGTITMFAVAILAFFALPVEKRHLAPLCMACALGLPSEHARYAMTAIDHGSARFVRYNSIQFCSAAILPLMLLVVWISGIAADSRLALLTIPTSLIALGLRCAMSRSGNLLRAGSPSPSILLREGLPYAISITTSDLIGRFDTFLMLWLATFAIQGLYAAALPVAGVLAVAPAALALFTFNAGAKPRAAISGRHLALMAVGTIAFQAITALSLGLMAHRLVLLVFRESFEGAVPFIYALLPAQALQGCVSVADGFLRGRSKPAVGIQARILGACTMLACILAMYGRWQSMSIPIGASIGAVVACAWIVRAIWSELIAPTGGGFQAIELGRDS